MKKKILLLVLTACSIIAGSECFSQTAKVYEPGNYVQVKAPVDTTGTKTGKTYTTSTGVVYPVYISKAGKLFIVRVSRNGDVYKQYLKI